MSDFKFKEWERLSKDVMDGEANAHVEVDGHNWLFRRCGACWFGCEAGHVGGEWNYLLCKPQKQPDSWTWLWVVADAFNLAHFVKNDARPQTLGRIWRLESSLFASWTESYGWSLFWNVEQFTRYHQSVPFRITFQGTPSIAPSSTLFNSLQNDWQNPNSELRFTAHFAALPELEQRLHGVATRIGTPQQFANLIKAALQVFCAHWPQNVEWMSLSFGATGAGFRFSLQGDDVFGIRERAIFGHIVRAFEPRQLADSPDLPPCVRTLTEGGWSRSFSVEVTRPSMHERLEAMLEVRDWLETNWPDGVKHLGRAV